MKILPVMSKLLISKLFENYMFKQMLIFFLKNNVLEAVTALNIAF